ncbi:hypothetical protein GPL21_25030 [Bradyrhizobium pachyrhizi]|uniref:Uncharacterized protein n=1 Tax=Bradyrhizobium pachyrhizi TaxID=280333 RepID=A0A844SWV4_9BRAD|nr:hypothetical protein [Bradyrhizobium pachyrhizi]MVT68364.1 hypothetical protein [Bradyrhizobium pachyrhizi]
MSFYVVVYTAAHLIGAVSTPLDLDQSAATTDHWTERNSHNGDDDYTFACEEHDKRPKRQTKINLTDRRFFESYCLSNQLSCEDLPNGHRVYPGLRCETTYVSGTENTLHPKIVRDTCGRAAAFKQLRAAKEKRP